MKRNAFQELMSASKRPKAADNVDTTAAPTAPSRPSDSIAGPRALLKYVLYPEDCPRSQVVKYNDDFVLVRDIYSKSQLHLLLIPRDRSVLEIHPLQAFKDATFLAKVRAQIEDYKPMLEKELIRLHRGERSTASGDSRWTDDLKIGVHALPSMTHLHVHIMTRDYSTDWMKTKKHYNSFTSPFFVDLDILPLPAADPLHQKSHVESFLKGDLTCWRCKKTFKTMPVLKEHLAAEWQDYLASNLTK